MNFSKGVNDACQEIVDNCSNCGLCVSECKLLQRIDEDLTSLAMRQPTVEEAYTCSLCGLCEGVCPSSLSPKNMFAATRTKAVADQDIDIEEYKYMFPDRAINVMKLYREVNGFNYQDLGPDQAGEVAFFPGCSMLTYDPPLVYTLMESLRSEYQDIRLLTDCCGLPLYQLGLQERGDRYTQILKEKLKNLGIKKLILACPNCYYQLQSQAADMEIQLLTIYEALEESQLFNTPIEEKNKAVVTIHDSCPDRFGGIFGNQARKALHKKGYSLIEMEHNQEKTICCGSGGEVSHFDPNLAQSLVESRLGEVVETKADILTAYCLSCVLNFSKNQDDIRVQHVLNLLLGFTQDFAGLKKKSKTLFEGPEGEKLWERVMAD